MRAHSALALFVVLGFGCARTTSAAEPRKPLALLTLNSANGAGDRFRTAENRASEGAFLGRIGADVIALEEVDVGVERSGNVDTAASIAEALTPGFAACTFDVAEPPHLRADGTKVGRCPAGAVVFGVAFHADDPFGAAPDGTPSGIMDVDESLNPTSIDRRPSATFGNALLVRAPWEVDDAYTVGLPGDALETIAPPPPSSLLAQLSSDARDPGALGALAAYNLATRARRSIEPRSALVVRLHAPSWPSLTIVVTHLESEGTSQLRAAQLATVVAVARAERSGANGRRVIVMGDFNMPPVESSPALLAASFVHAAGPDGTSEIDQIWTDAALTAAASARVSTEGLSDHPFAAVTTVR